MKSSPPPHPPHPRKMGGQFYGTLGDLKFSPTPLGELSQMEGLKFSTLFYGEGGDGRGCNRVFSTGGWRESILTGPKLLISPIGKVFPIDSPHQRFIPPNPLNSTFLLKTFFQSRIMTSKMH